MGEKIFTIPINEAFGSPDGCPLCRLEARFEQQTLEYTLGAAMMEPDVRISINRAGFCSGHFAAMHRMKSKLPLALITESHLDEVLRALDREPSGGRKTLFSPKGAEEDDACEAAEHFAGSCFVCGRVSVSVRQCCSNVAYLWANDPAFPDKLAAQPYFCIRHFSGILTAAKAELKKEQYASLYRAMCALERGYISSLRASVTEFCESFDHKNTDRPLTDAARHALGDFSALL